MGVHADAERRGKAPMTLGEPEEAPQENEYLEISAKVLKDASVIMSKSLVERMLKTILLPKDRQEKRNCLLEENIKSFFLGLIKVRHLFPSWLFLALILE